MFSKARTLFLISVLPLFLCQAGENGESPTVATFSIVAVDKETGEIGIAVQSRIVGVGSIVPFAKAGVGGIATQAYANVRYGPVGLLMLRTGSTPQQCIEMLTKNDPEKEHRQVGIVSADGNAANFTGKECQDWAGEISGDGFCVQGNILTGEEVVKTMAKAFTEAKGILPERLIAALKAGQAAGGDKRGMQSAALLVVREGWGYGGLNDRFRDIRVDEHEKPIEELERVYLAHRKLFPRPE